HTRSKRDWSSDVCSSDLIAVGVEARVLLDWDQILDVRDRRLVELLDPALPDHQREIPVVVREDDDVPVDRLSTRERALNLPEEEIGRASCRERVELWRGT